MRDSTALVLPIEARLFCLPRCRLFPLRLCFCAFVVWARLGAEVTVVEFLDHIVPTMVCPGMLRKQALLLPAAVSSRVRLKEPAPHFLWREHLLQ